MTQLTPALDEETIGIMEFITSSDYLGVTLTAAQGRIVSTFYSSDHRYRELVLLSGMRGGKSLLLACMILYEFYLLITVQRDSRKLNGKSLAHYWFEKGVHISNGQRIYITVVEGADEAIVLNYVKGMVERCAIFKEFDIILGERTISCGDIYVTSASLDSLTVIGRTYKMVVFDEISRAAMLSTKRSISTVYSSFQKSAATFGKHVKIIASGSPMYHDDYAMDLLLTSAELHVSAVNVQDINRLLRSKRYQNKVQDRLGYNLTAFEMNSYLTENSEWFIKMAADSPAAFRRDYEAFPWDRAPQKQGCACGSQEECSKC